MLQFAEISYGKQSQFQTSYLIFAEVDYQIFSKSS